MVMVIIVLWQLLLLNAVTAGGEVNLVVVRAEATVITHVLWTELLEARRVVLIDVGVVALVHRVTDIIGCQAGLARLVETQVIADEGCLEDLTTVQSVLGE